MKFRHSFKTPIGFLSLSGSEQEVFSIEFSEIKQASSKGLPELYKVVENQLNAYFKGELQIFTFSHAQPGTAFQHEVWNQLEKIPFGVTQSYLDIARQLGDAKKIRAVGNANGKNNLAIVVPCHRVIGESGKLVGYAGGLWRKQWLLEHEAAIAHGVQQLF